MPITHPTPKLVIFDCDGVLVDSETSSNEVISNSLARYGLVLAPERCMELFVGGTMTGVAEKSRAMGANLPADWLDEVREEIFARLQDGIALVPGVLALLDRLRAADIPFCVASNGSEAKMRITLGQHDLWEVFHPNAMFSAYSLGVSKPEPGLFLAAASHFDVEARDCVVIEDSESGALAAARAGMRCLGHAPHGGADPLIRHNAEVFQSMDEVPGLIGL